MLDRYEHSAVCSRIMPMHQLYFMRQKSIRQRWSTSTYSEQSKRLPTPSTAFATPTDLAAIPLPLTFKAQSGSKYHQTGPAQTTSSTYSHLYPGGQNNEHVLLREPNQLLTRFTKDASIDVKLESELQSCTHADCQVPTGPEQRGCFVLSIPGETLTAVSEYKHAVSHRNGLLAATDPRTSDPWGLLDHVAENVLSGIIADVARELDAGCDVVITGLVNAEVGAK